MQENEKIKIRGRDGLYKILAVGTYFHLVENCESKMKMKVRVSEVETEGLALLTRNRK